MPKLAIRAAIFSLAISCPALTQAQHQDSSPSLTELQSLIRGSWSTFAASIRQQDELAVTPTHFKNLPRAICRHAERATFECVSLVEYDLQTGVRRSSLVRHYVGRDEQGQLHNVIVIRELPGSG